MGRSRPSLDNLSKAFRPVLVIFLTFQQQMEAVQTHGIQTSHLCCQELLLEKGLGKRPDCSPGLASGSALTGWLGLSERLVRNTQRPHGCELRAKGGNPKPA